MDDTLWLIEENALEMTSPSQSKIADTSFGGRILMSSRF